MSFDLSDPSAESSALNILTDEQKSRLGVILDQYLIKLESGVPQDPRLLIDEHPDLTAPLELYLASLSDLQAVAAGFGNDAEQSSPKPEVAPNQHVEGAPSQGQTRIGDFVMGPEIGRGGMGVVYDAQQISLDRRVALKVLPFAAVLDSKQIARFKNEAQAAAQLHHPHIVPVFAIGSERGVHYYAMQYIDGQPLDRAIAELRKAGALETSLEADTVVNAVDETVDAQGSLLVSNSIDRKGFFRQVAKLGMDTADALHAAHEYGVVHRDIKPSNLILDQDGKIWVTDFGLARCQNDVALTKTGDMVGTMRYMSPEQTFGQSALVDHRTDIYSLAITLYELLTLTPAISGEDQPAVLRSLDQRQPARISKLCPDIPVDLETVIWKAMSSERDDRYTTAQEFARDLQRVMNGDSPNAQPPKVSERVGRWARRHKRLVGAASVIGLVAILGFALSTFLIARERNKAEANFRRAESRRRQAHETVDRFGALFAEKLAGIPGAEEIRREVLEDSLWYYRDFVAEAANDTELQDDLAMTYSKMALLIEQIGTTKEALQHHRKAIKLFESLVVKSPKNWEHQRLLALCQNNLALTQRRAGRLNKAEQAYGKAVELQQGILEKSNEKGITELVTRDLAVSFTNRGLVQFENGPLGSAVDSFESAIELQARALKQDPANAEQLRILAATYNNLSAVYLNKNDAQAAECYETALGLQKAAVESAPNDQQLKSAWALTYTNYGALQSRLGHTDEAADLYDRAVAIQKKLVEASPRHKSYRRDLVVSYNNRGLMFSKVGSLTKSEQSFQLALDLERPLITQYPNDLDLQSMAGGVFNNLGIVQEKLDRHEDAAIAFKQAVEHQRVAFSQAPTLARYRQFLSQHYFNYGRVLRKLGYPEQAVKSALARRELWPNDPDHLFAIAKELTLAGAKLKSQDVAAINREQCEELAVETVHRAVESGLELPKDRHDAKLEWFTQNAAFVEFHE